VLQRPSGSPVGEWIQEHLGPLVVAFFVFVLPAIRAALAAKKQREELKRRASGTAAEPQPGQAWKDLLEGRQQAPPPLPPQTQAPEFAEEESLDDNPPPALVELPSASATEPAAEEQAEEYVAARERQEFERQEQVAAAEYVASSPYRADVAPQEASAVPIVSRPAAAPQGAAERWLFPKEPARDRRAALRRAIVLREVLGPPVGLR
jgi:hypothetical protein